MPTPRLLSKREIRWLIRLQKVLDACPNKRIGFYTIGDSSIHIYDRRFDDQINEKMDTSRACDFSQAVNDAGASLDDQIEFPSNVHSVAG